jgi:hypothetical protein
MAVVTPTNSGHVGLSQRPEITTAQPKGSRPVLVWAGLGVVFIAVQLYTYVSWVAAGIHTVDPGPTDPGSMQWRANLLQGISVVATITVVWLLLIRPVLRDRKLSFDGMLVLAALTIVWQDQFVNYLAPGFTYNSLFLNVNSWDSFVPGWVSPNHDVFPTPVLTVGGFYIWGLIPGMMLTCWVMRKARARWPEVSNLGLAGIGLLFCFFLDLAFEPVFMWAFGYFTYPVAHDFLTVFKGHYYQFPMWEALMWGTAWASFSFLRFYRNDKGESIVEKGADDVLVGHRRRKTVVRVLALAGAMNLIFGIYNIVFTSTMAMHSAAWPSDIVDRSYFMNGMCGPGTSYICPGPGVPIMKVDPGESGYRIDPEGRLIGPEESVDLPPDPARTWKDGDPASAYYGDHPPASTDEDSQDDDAADSASP